MSFRPPLPRPRPAKGHQPPAPKGPRKPGPALTAKVTPRRAPHKPC
jgi:hypothetical protein